MTGRILRLDPAPDANTSSNYTVRGTYIRDIASIDLDEDLPIMLAAVQAGTLARLAIDFGKGTVQVLAGMDRAMQSALANQQARTRTKFQRRAQWSRNRGIRR